MSLVRVLNEDTEIDSPASDTAPSDFHFMCSFQTDLFRELVVHIARCEWHRKMNEQYREGHDHADKCALTGQHTDVRQAEKPTLWDFCVSMVGRGDVEGSKRNVAMNAWLPQASRIPVACFDWDGAGWGLLSPQVFVQRRIISVVNVLTPLAECPSQLKDRQAMLSQWVFVLKMKIKQAFPFWST